MTVRSKFYPTGSSVEEPTFPWQVEDRTCVVCHGRQVERDRQSRVCLGCAHHVIYEDFDSVFVGETTKKDG